MGARAFAGRWRVAELPDLDDDYLDLSPDPHVTLRASRGRTVDGEYEFGAQEGDIDGRVEPPGDGPPRMTFTFEGSDELDPTHGCGFADLADANTLVGEMRYHRSDTCRFVWRRKPARVRRRQERSRKAF